MGFVVFFVIFCLFVFLTKTFRIVCETVIKNFNFCEQYCVYQEKIMQFFFVNSFTDVKGSQE
jgi:hypothetical protein